MHIFNWKQINMKTTFFLNSSSTFKAINISAKKKRSPNGWQITHQLIPIQEICIHKILQRRKKLNKFLCAKKKKFDKLLWKNVYTVQSVFVIPIWLVTSQFVLKYKRKNSRKFFSIYVRYIIWKTVICYRKIFLLYIKKTSTLGKMCCLNYYKK